jgi:hypothetical protein
MPEAAMTEQQWAASTDPITMLKFTRTSGRFDARKVRLFVVAVCRRTFHLSDDQRGRDAVLVAERYADGAATDDELFAAAHAANEASYRDGGGFRDAQLHLATYAPHTAVAFLEPPAHARPSFGGYAPEAFSNPEDFACMACIDAAEAVAREAANRGAPDENYWPLHEAALDLEYLRQASLLRDIFGPLPFRPARFDPHWRTPLVLSLAHAAYEERVAPDPQRPGWLVFDPPRLLILADALEDAGADEPEILEHLRGPGEHVRGCHVVDLILDRS